MIFNNKQHNMDVRIRLQNGDVKIVEGITLAEQTSNRVYIEDETETDNAPQKYPNAVIIEILDSESIGYVGTDGETIVDDVNRAEQVADNKIEMRFNSGKTEERTGDLDRGYSY